ncbi:MAG: hypothetical protein ACJ79Y_19980 [Myxococcales bacterium]
MHGTVVNRFGESVAGARVQIGSASAGTTDADGKFTVGFVPVTYDAAVVVDDPPVPTGFRSVSRAVVYQRLTRRDPVLFVPGLRTQPGTTNHSTTLRSVTTSGLSGVPLLWAFINGSGVVVAAGVVSAAEMRFVWNGHDAVNPGSLVAMIASAPQGLTASGEVPVTAGDAPLSVTVPVTAARTITLSAIGRPPADPCRVASFEVVVPASDGTVVTAARFIAPVQPGIATALDSIVGFTSEVPLSLRIQTICPPSSATTVVARSLSPSTTTFDIDIPAPPLITNPLSGGTPSAAAPLAWTAPEGSISVLHFDRVESDGFVSGTLDVATTSKSTRFPRLDTLQAKLVPGSTLRWRVEAWGGLTGTDALADATGFGALLAGTGNFSQGVSESSTVRIPR